MKLFNDEGQYTEEANEVDRKLYSFLQDIVKDLDNPRELYALVGSTIGVVVASEIIKRTVEKRQAERQTKRLSCNKCGHVWGPYEDYCKCP